MFFSGGITNVYDYALGLRQAKAEAIKSLVEAIKVKARTEFANVTKGQNLSEADLGRCVEDTVGLVADNIDVSGIQPK